MKTLEWRLSRGHNWISSTIGWFGAGFYAHIDVVGPYGDTLRGARADVVFDDKKKVHIPPGYQDRPIDYQLKLIRLTSFKLIVSDEQWRKYWQFSDKQLSKPYDTRALLESFILEKFGKEPRDWRDESAWWCSEEVAANLEFAGIIGTLPNSVRSIEPGDCALILVGAGASWIDLKV